MDCRKIFLSKNIRLKLNKIEISINYNFF